LAFKLENEGGRNRREPKEKIGHSRYITGEKDMHELETHSRRGIVEWVDRQERFAESVLKHDAAGSKHKLAVSIVLITRMMRFRLVRYVEPEPRRKEILEDLVTNWGTVRPGHRHPPASVLVDLDAEASRRAFRERYPALARFSDEIAAMRGELERASGSAELSTGQNA
jgi:hypothetical protein